VPCNKYLYNVLLIRKLVKSNLFFIKQIVIIGIEKFIKISSTFKKTEEPLFKSMKLFLRH
jgi:hypothetical protein